MSHSDPASIVPPDHEPDHEIVLVDEDDRPIGSAPKLPPHQNGGQLHRAFSVFVFSPDGRMLLQRRALGKYHFGGLWTNTCCSHPRPGQAVERAAIDRLQYEMGFSCPLTHRLRFIYRAHDPLSGLTEHEVDHVFTGTYAEDPKPNPAEVMDWSWYHPEVLRAEVARSPERFSPWFKIVLEQVISLEKYRTELDRKVHF